MGKLPMSWDAFVSEYRAVIGGPAPVSSPSVSYPPDGLFPEKNFMADEVMGFFYCGGDLWAEVSTGTFGPDRVVGVTLAHDNGAESWRERSEGVEVFDTIEGVRASLVGNGATLFGE